MKKFFAVGWLLAAAFTSSANADDQTYEEFRGGRPPNRIISPNLVDAPASPPTENEKAKATAAWEKMTPQGFPKAYNFFGKARLQELNALVLQGLTWIVQVNPQCKAPREGMAGVAGSSTRADAIFFVWCGEKQFYFSESNLKARKVPGAARDARLEHPPDITDEQADIIASMVRFRGYQCEEPRTVASAGIFVLKWLVTCENDTVYEVSKNESGKPAVRRVR